MKTLHNIVEDIYENIRPLCEGEALDFSEEDIEKFGEDMKRCSASLG